MDLNRKCPACREPYDQQNYKFTPPDEQEYVVLEKRHFKKSYTNIIFNNKESHNKNQNVKKRKTKNLQIKNWLIGKILQIFV